jgi:hypothetical protein
MRGSFDRISYLIRRFAITAVLGGFGVAFLISGSANGAHSLSRKEASRLFGGSEYPNHVCQAMTYCYGEYGACSRSNMQITCDSTLGDLTVEGNISWCGFFDCAGCGSTCVSDDEVEPNQWHTCRHCWQCRWDPEEGTCINDEQDDPFDAPENCSTYS